MSDTISKDPKMQEEARRAAASVASPTVLPKLNFNPIAVAKEEYERRVDPKYLPTGGPKPMGFDSLWELLTRPFVDQPAQSEVLFALEEAEYRQIVSSLFRRVNALNMEHWAKLEEQKAEAVHRSTIIAIEERVGPQEASKLFDSIPDITRGILRKSSSITVKKMCIMHPDGCPESPEAVTPLVAELSEDNPIGQALKMALEKIVAAKKR